MNSMQDAESVVIGGVDAHSDTHEAAALDDRGALLGGETFSTTFAGYAGLLDWLRGFGRVDVVAIESTGAYAAGWCATCASTTSRCSRSTSRTPTPAAGAARRPIDAEVAARLPLAGKATATSPSRTSSMSTTRPSSSTPGTRLAQRPDLPTA